jgi:hypothetical protein
MTDPVQDANDDDERQVLELAQLDAQLDDEQKRCEEMLDRDPIRAIWFDFEPPSDTLPNEGGDR